MDDDVEVAPSEVRQRTNLAEQLRQSARDHDAGLHAKMDALNARIDKHEQALDERLAPFGKRLTAIEGPGVGIKAPEVLATMQEQVTALRETVDEIVAYLQTDKTVGVDGKLIPTYGQVREQVVAARVEKARLAAPASKIHSPFGGKAEEEKLVAGKDAKADAAKRDPIQSP